MVWRYFGKQPIFLHNPHHLFLIDPQTLIVGKPQADAPIAVGMLCFLLAFLYQLPQSQILIRLVFLPQPFIIAAVGYFKKCTKEWNVINILVFKDCLIFDCGPYILPESWRKSWYSFKSFSCCWIIFISSLLVGSSFGCAPDFRFGYLVFVKFNDVAYFMIGLFFAL